MTSNLPFESCTEVLGSKRLTGATLDWLTHCCHIIETKGESYRRRDAKARTRLPSHQPIPQEASLSTKSKSPSNFKLEVLLFSISIRRLSARE